MKKPEIPLSFNFSILAVGWTIFIVAMMVYDFHATKANTIELARLQASTGLEKDIVYRKWNAINGGVYGSVSETTKPNPYLKNKERDISTPSGSRNLTMINPAYMTRQVHELEQANNGVVGHITSLNPIRPENAADGWETKALQQFEQGVKEVSSLEWMDEKNYLRVMRPLMVIQGCMPCHAFQGYQVGEVRGGLSISVPMAQWFENSKRIVRDHVIFLVVLWAVVLTGLFLGFFNLMSKIRQVNLTQTDLSKLKNVLDQINDSVFLIHPQTHLFTYVNQAAIMTSGYSETELFQMSLGDFASGDAQQLYEKYIDELKKRPEKIFHYESIFSHKNGETNPVELQLQYLKLEQGTELVAVVVRDISSRKEHEKRQQEMVSQLQRSQKLESVGQLAAGIAHEINTPIQYIGTNLDFLADSCAEVSSLVERQQSFIEGDENKQSTAYTELEKLRNEVDWDYLKKEIPQAVSQSQDGVRQISSIVLAMKDFSHPGSEKMEFSDINQLIKTIVTVARSEWKSVAEVQLALTRKHSIVACRPNEISQVLLNILINAAHAVGDCQQDGILQLGTIYIRTALKERFFEIQVQDTGRGIPEDHINNIFDPFFTTKEVGKGTGQGLAIAHDIITNKHHGSLGVESEEGKGTTFTILLPLDNKDEKNLL
ncbi:MAG: PAS domain S-box-containing protein [Desulforhopalus sp.]|jgi:PAS domain S-box-containing protein